MASSFPPLTFALLLCLTTTVLHSQQTSAFENGVFSPGYEGIVGLNPVLAQGGGAGIVEKDGKRYFIAVGVTSIKGAEPAERVRQLRVAKANALRAIAEYIEPVKVETETRLTEKTTIESNGKSKTGRTFKDLDETTRTSVKATLQSPEQVGTWKNKEGTLFFMALGRVLP
ncbi:LPP20 family lipoprotein [Prosthecobacter sp.]|uniref:LPP20 family lipoprotein n=1 Tax=Prosthecobacter sp. TaxID=1965333 RepID=UPI001DC10739|nr:LPP20 family lipoprotein [Prosthecobacter sp.]MCB1279052.1 LPP20 family lipoprotein [Prosthecobacter sp.]